MNELERNKKAAMAFYDLMFNQCQPRQAIERYAGAVYIQHQPARGGRQGRVHCLLRRKWRRNTRASAFISNAPSRKAITSSCTAIRNGQDTRTRIGRRGTCCRSLQDESPREAVPFLFPGTHRARRLQHAYLCFRCTRARATLPLCGERAWRRSQLRMAHPPTICPAGLPALYLVLRKRDEMPVRAVTLPQLLDGLLPSQRPAELVSRPVLVRMRSDTRFDAGLESEC